MYIYIYMYICTVNVYVFSRCIYVYMYIYVYIYICVYSRFIGCTTDRLGEGAFQNTPPRLILLRDHQQQQGQARPRWSGGGRKRRNGDVLVIQASNQEKRSPVRGERVRNGYRVQYPNTLSVHLCRFLWRYVAVGMGGTG